ncbi:hypothetical protein GOV08_04130 [Candidatus Woesearchaeota archaeon]|nr:hypothetical protein [Candidatus Woesearchaeota archaeon]
MFKGKRAVSPIIAAVLLVVITIAIGATTMAFIRSLTDTNLETAQEKATRIACGADLDIDIPVIQNSYKICYNDSASQGEVVALLHNVGTVNIKDFQFTVILKNGSIYQNSSVDNTGLAKNAYKEFTFYPAGTVTDPTNDVDQYIIEPVIQGAPGKGDTICSDVAITRDISEIDTCT